MLSLFSYLHIENSLGDPGADKQSSIMHFLSGLSLSTEDFTSTNDKGGWS